MKKDAVGYRAKEAATQKEFRAANREHSRNYMKNYFKNWLAIPLNMKCHRARTVLSSLKESMRNSNGAIKFREENSIIYKNLLSIGWSCWLDKSLCVNHKVSLYHIFNFNIDVPTSVAYDLDNLEIISRVDNSSLAKRMITKETIMIAKKMEKKYSCLKGLCKYLKAHIGETK